MVVVVELIKFLTVTSKETEGEKQTKKNHLLEQAANVLNWMYDFDPERLNNNELKIPSYIRKIMNAGNDFIR